MSSRALPALIRAVGEYAVAAAVVGFLVAAPILLRGGAGAQAPRSAAEVVSAVSGIAF